ncbi:gamma-glutamyltransferase 5a [Tachysurus fulvidraco]|uniref:gamma-glutamyltransferase 5a n=1 Tax=Tachysurus fulvidraco TaxID=1234273 RepID=UPI001FEF9ABA|nr:gamma-glutamyltransferase 5a [Tachysurus fulvidraco]
MPRRRKDRLRAGVCFAVIFIVLILILIIVCTVKSPESHKCTRGMFRKAAVAADSQICSSIGRDVLRSGGSAVDGAIAALICTSVINPQSMGLGGGVIFTIRDKTGKVKVINARETTPKGFKADLLSECSNVTGAHWVGVPGELRGYEYAHRLYGRLPWRHLFEPTISLAKRGVKISFMLDQYLPVLKEQQTALSRLFMYPNGTLKKEGDTVKFEKLTETLQKIADRGAEEFYSGDVAHALVRDVQAAGGNLTLEDLSSFSVTESEAWSISLDKYLMYFPPPPAGGALLSFILKVMEGYELDPTSIHVDERVLTYHRYIEACKFANGLKQFIKDPKFSSDKEAHNLIGAMFAERVRLLISSNITHDAQYYNITPHPDTQGTTHISVLAEDGMAVSVTSTINHIFGSRVLSPNTGVLLNNELADFCGRTKHIHPGEKPPSSMAPVILYSSFDKHTLVIGASGGSMITTGLATALMNYLWLGKTLKDSIASPVVFVDGKNDLSFEKAFNQDVIKALQQLGHTVVPRSYFYNTVNAVSKHEDECVNAISDKRKKGEPAGY